VTEPELMILDGYGRAPVGKSCSVAMLIMPSEGDNRLVRGLAARARLVPHGLGVATAEPGGTVELQQYVQRRGTPHRLIVSGGDGWMVDEIRVGQRVQAMGSIPASVFAPGVLAHMAMDEAMPGVVVGVKLTNLSSAEPAVVLRLDGVPHAFCRNGRWRKMDSVPKSWQVAECKPRMVALHRLDDGALVVDELTGGAIVESRKGNPRFAVARMRAMERVVGRG
jgi:hypothetical protein